MHKNQNRYRMDWTGSQHLMTHTRSVTGSMSGGNSGDFPTMLQLSLVRELGSEVGQAELSHSAYRCAKSQIGCGMGQAKPQHHLAAQKLGLGAGLLGVTGVAPTKP